MSHPLGRLVNNLTALAVYSTAQAELRHAHRLADAGDLRGAALELDHAARAAQVLVRAADGVDEAVANHWRQVVGDHRRSAERMRTAAGQSLVTA